VGAEDQVFTKCAWRLIPLIMLLYVISNIDRVNVGFAALTMNKDLGFSRSVYGFGSGIFLISYSLSQVPANLFLAPMGPRRGVAIILAIWAPYRWRMPSYPLHLHSISFASRSVLSRRASSR
jgi:MFS transporter, ACS family, tartrate transporter